jgi:hypothetical protein
MLSLLIPSSLGISDSSLHPGVKQSERRLHESPRLHPETRSLWAIIIQLVSFLVLFRLTGLSAFSYEPLPAVSLHTPLLGPFCVTSPGRPEGSICAPKISQISAPWSHTPRQPQAATTPSPRTGDNLRHASVTYPLNKILLE